MYGREDDHSNSAAEEGTVKARSAALVTSDVEVHAEKRDIDAYFSILEDRTGEIEQDQYVMESDE